MEPNIALNSEVNQAPVQLTPAPIRPSEPTKKSLPKWPLIIVVIILITTVLTGGYVMLNKNLKVNPKPTTKTAQTPTPKIITTSPTPASDASASWKTYAGNGFSLKYPSGFALLEQSNNRTILNHNIIIVKTMSDISSLDCRGDCPLIEKKNLTINNYQVNRITGSIGSIGGNIPQSYITYEIKNPVSNKYFVATIYELPQDESYEIQSKKYPDNRTFKVITAAQDETLTQILSTFKFTDQTTQADPTANWISYTSEKGKFSLSYPPSWVQPTHKEMCNPGLFDRALYLGPDDRSVLVCQSSYTGQMYVVSVEGDKRTDSSYNLSTGFANIQEQDVAVSGIVGQRTEATASGQWGEGSINDGTTVVHYLFYAYGRTYITSYIGAPHDVLKDFDSMVKTLTFMQ